MALILVSALFVPATASARFDVWVEHASGAAVIHAYDATVGGRDNDIVYGYEEFGADYFFARSRNGEKVDAGLGCTTDPSSTEARCSITPEMNAHRADIDGHAGDDVLENSPTDPVGLTATIHPDVHGGRGEDRLVGADADLLKTFESLYGDGGRDELLALDGSDLLAGGPGGDLLKGGPGNDSLGNPGLDPGIDIFSGGTGNDSIYAVDSRRDRRINCGEGDDTLERDAVDPPGKLC